MDAAPGASRYHFVLSEDVPDAVLHAMLAGVRHHRREVDGSILVGDVEDQDELAGIVSRLSLLGYTVVEVRRAASA